MSERPGDGDVPEPSQHHEVVRWYTRARRFPRLIGRTHDGTRLPGGPYTYTQFIGGFVVLFIGMNTMSLWARHGLLTNAALLGTATYGTTWLLGRLPLGSRGPISVLTGVVRAATRPHTGRVAGRAVHLARPHQLRHRITVLHAPTGLEALLTTDNRRAGVPTGAPPLAGVPPTNVQRLLAASRSGLGGAA